MYKVVLLRHGESIWNKENRFTGWVDVEITEKGVEEAREAGVLLNEHRISFDIAFTSVLKRSIKTLWAVLDEMDLEWIPVEKSWRLNEKHYGKLQGLSKTETAERYGEEQVHLWRRGYEVRPPALGKKDKMCPANLFCYKGCNSSLMPLTESLEDTCKRVMVYWRKKIAPAVKAGKRVLIVGHSNSLNALVKHFDKIRAGKTLEIYIPTGMPLVYEFDKNMSTIKHYYLGDPKKVEKEVELVKEQGMAVGKENNGGSGGKSRPGLKT